jgi:protein AbiQ
VKFYTLSDAYITHLKTVDARVPDNYNATRAYIGVVMEINGHLYLAPLTSYKPKQDKLHASTPSVFKLHEKGDEQNKLGMIQINNMLPVTEAELTLLDMAAQPVKYRAMLLKQLEFIKANQEKIKERAEKFYKLVVVQKHEVFSRISCDFVALEAACATFVRQEPPTALAEAERAAEAEPELN